MSDMLQEALNKSTRPGFPKPAKRWKHKAWGEAKRNPRIRGDKETERAKRAIAQKLRFTLD
ncbi:MAG: hypothetical protein ACREBG_03565 [Pyrinomonadaceae bacterium]